jgi:hypothetical protein
MFKISGKDIIITRGDTGMLTLEPTLNGETLTDYTGVLSIKNSVEDEDYILQKAVSDGKIFFSHEDTNSLDVGSYVYDIEITSGDQVATIGPAKFKVEGDITR